MPDVMLAVVRQKLADPATVAKANKDDLAALVAYYADTKAAPLWVGQDGFNTSAKAAIDEIRKADDWGLVASAFELPALASGQASAEAQGEVEVKLGLQVLKYARYARGGRYDPRSLSRILDMDPPLEDPKTVLTDIAAASAAGAYLRGLHPKHEQFERLRQALLKARGPAPKEEPVDEALKVKLPAGKTLKPGVEHADIALLRQRLKVPAEAGAKETLFDPKLADAVKAFQREKGLDPTGAVTAGTRNALNGESDKRKPDSGRDVQRLLLNMERWRWMPKDLGRFYVIDNVPEFYTRVIKDGKEVFKEKIIVGQPEWATPTFSADMQFVVFNPSWGVPDGIKVRELMPRLQKAGGGGGFFGALFGGGGGNVLKAYGLTAYRNGKPVDPDSVDWSGTDIRQYSFTQPPGGKNPLGFVKFRFPNKHDVYMHDTTQRELFAQPYRALSHGCMRVQSPRRLADILLGEDKGWSADRVGQAIGSSGEIALDKPVPVHVTYFTATVDDSGHVSTFGDIYGHDSRLAAAMTGRAISYERGVETSSVNAAADGAVADDGISTDIGRPGKKGAKNNNKKSNSNYRMPSDFSEAMSGLMAN